MVRIANKKKAQRLSKLAQQLTDLRYLGDEPQGNDEPLFGVALSQALSWYSYMASLDDAREYLNTYFAHDRLMQKRLDRVPDTWFPLTAAWLARISARGFIVDNSQEEISKRIGDAIRHIPEEEKQETPKIIVKVDRVNLQCDEIISHFETIIDQKNTTFDVRPYLIEREASVAVATRIVAFYRPYLDELTQALKGKDRELSAAYGPKQQLLTTIKCVKNLIDGAERFCEAPPKVKVTRKPRKRKPLDPTKALKKFQLKAEDKDLEIKSVDPRGLLGAQEAWLFNTRYSWLTVLRADSVAGMSVKGTTILGVDDKTSLTKKIGRKTKDTLQKVHAGKTARRKLMDEIKTSKIEAKTRTNGDTLLLFVTK